MGTVFKRQYLAITIIAVFVLMTGFSTPITTAIDGPSNLNVGPYVDRVIFQVISAPDQRVLALQAGSIQMDSSFIESAFISTLEADPDISFANIPRNGYGHITINCNRFPLNITALRRAFAFAFDKTRVRTEIVDISSQEHDSVVPAPSSWCIEDNLPYHYYTAQSATGNAILDAAGFSVDSGTGYRLAPNGSPFNISIEYSSTSPAIAGAVCQIAVDALTALHVGAFTHAVDFDNLMLTVDNNDDFDMVFYAYDFPNHNVDWLAYNFWGELADVPNENPCNFRNATYDSWRDQLLLSTDYDEVYEAAAAMQLILHENVPMVVAYDNFFKQAYRNDMFEGYVEDQGRGVAGTWTIRKLQLISGTPGGALHIAVPDDPESFNIFTAHTPYASMILTELWPRLYMEGPNLQAFPYLTERLQIETHQDNPVVPAGHTRFTIDIIQDATWSNGMPITAEDAVFSLKYAVESGVYGNPAGRIFTDLVSAYAPSTYQSVVEFETESLWHFYKFAYTCIIPKHIFNNFDGIGYDGWNSWDPVFDPAAPHITSGPFTLTDPVIGDFYELTANPDFRYYSPENDTTSTSPSTISTTPPSLPLQALTILVGAGVLLVLVILLKRRR
ncbi:MAG: hypothetical protein EAX87_14160 [Candidatus Thorarchaeota archaeon]|nr:hypothetical protein [Candidatus Thorarchaeota archaeon]